MSGSGAFVPRVPIPGMPEDLADAVYAHGQEIADEIIENWEAIGEEGREIYRRYVERAHLRRTRRERCELAALQLVRPDVPLPIPDSGGGG